MINKILDNYWDWNVPVKIQNIATHLRIGFVYSESLLDNCESQIENVNNIYKVVINKKRKLIEQRFALAHSIGHIVNGDLSKQKKHIDYKDSFSTNVANTIEKNANNFALQLLIPNAAINFYIYEKEITSIKYLAKVFDVSEVAMYHQLKDLFKI